MTANRFYQDSDGIYHRQFSWEEDQHHRDQAANVSKYKTHLESRGFVVEHVEGENGFPHLIVHGTKKAE